MTLEYLQNEMITAMKSRDMEKKNVLSSVIGAIKNAAIDKKCKDNISEELIRDVLIKEQKILKEQIDTCPETHSELKEEYIRKYNILTNYCPKIINDPDQIKCMILDILKEKCIELNPMNKGIIMKTIAPILKGTADMKVVNQVVGGLLK